MKYAPKYLPLEKTHNTLTKADDQRSEGGGMTYSPDIHHRRSIRLKGYDYSRAGLYFITICTQDRLHLFGEIKNGIMILNAPGEMVETVWNDIPQYYEDFNIHDFVVMPNHIHGIIEIVNTMKTTQPVGAGPRTCPCHPHFQPETGSRSRPEQSWNGQPEQIGGLEEGQPRGVAPTITTILIPTMTTAMTIPDIVHRFKTLTTKRYTDGVRQNGWTPFPGKLWQRNYYEHIIRNEDSYQRISEYIINNPLHWLKDGNHDQ